MAGILAKVNSGEVSLAANGTKTILQAVAAANHRVKVTGFSCAFTGKVAADPPVRLELLRQTDAGTGGNAATPVKNNSEDGETLQTTALKGLWSTTEPTAGDILFAIEVHPQSGYRELLPYGQEIIVPGGSRIAVRCISGALSATINAIAQIDFEE